MKKKTTKHRKKISPKLVALFGFMGIAILLVGGFSFAKMYGKNSLYQNAGTDTITLQTLPIEDTELADVEIWNENWVRYQGEIYQYNEDLLTFLFMGIDSLEEVEAVPQGISGGQADALFLVDSSIENCIFTGVSRCMILKIRKFAEEPSFNYKSTALVELATLQERKKDLQKQELFEAMESSCRSYDDIMKFLNTK